LDVADQIVYFERGEVNYTGAAGQLASDPELLHSLFLKGDER
jgi:ABC-type branched-subunit amino acid transport system ATPase component